MEKGTMEGGGGELVYTNSMKILTNIGFKKFSSSEYRMSYI
jgi:hypothetical protein